MEPKLQAPRIAYPDKDRLLALAAPKPASTRIWTWCGATAAVVGGILALLTPTTDRANMPPLAHYTPQSIEAKTEVVKIRVVQRIKTKPPKVLVAKKTDQATREVVPEIERLKVEIITPTPAPVRIAYTAPQPICIKPIHSNETEQEPSLWDQLTEPFRTAERPEPKQLIASITFTNPFKTTDDETF